MKVIVADKISDRGVQLLQEQRGWNIVQPSKDTLKRELPDADALIVRSATKVTAELFDRAKNCVSSVVPALASTISISTKPPSAVSWS